MTLTASSSTLLIAGLIIVAVKNCRAFKHFNAMNVIKVSSISRCNAATRDFIHESEYPGDDFSHILGKYFLTIFIILISTSLITQVIAFLIIIVIYIIINIIIIGM
jgi:hypothetical protein